jgi:hypothetical protein
VVILRQMKGQRMSNFIFRGFEDGQPLSHMAMLTLLRRLKLDVVTHGFRS